ncbi:CoA transferase, partial [Acinetobacter baumannii]
MPIALNGLTVLDFSTSLPAPFATLFLVVMGSEVSRIESPTG